MSYDNILVNKPSYEKACGFCVDEIFNLTPFACHKFWVHQFWQKPAWKDEEYQFFKETYPEYETLMNLQCQE
jgi:hypothetical protein